MTNTKRFLNQTLETASFAFREFFRPLSAVLFFVTSPREPAEAEKLDKHVESECNERALAEVYRAGYTAAKSRLDNGEALEEIRAEVTWKPNLLGPLEDGSMPFPRKVH